MTREEAIAVVSRVFGANALELIKAQFPCREGTRGHSIAYAEKENGDSVGKRDAGPWQEYRPDGRWV